MMEFLDLFLHIILAFLFFVLGFGCLVLIILGVYMFIIFVIMDDFPILGFLLLALFSLFLFTLILYYPLADFIESFFVTYIFPEYLYEKYMLWG